MTELKTGDKAPPFTLPATGGQTVSLKDFAGKPLVLYFYPKDDTSGCTAEACDFRDNLPQFNRLGAQVLGISKDSVTSHEKFVKKYNLNFPLASDEDGKMCQAYGVWVEKSMYGRKYQGIDRSTFLIDASGRIAAFWRKVKVSGHVEEVRESLEALSKKAA
jgi:thioredoxin-dependent peroxiredoxin